MSGDTVDDPGAPETSSMGFLVGRVIADKYELVSLVGQGGMGAVFAAKNTATLKRCAVKLLTLAELGSNEAAVRRFFREARASSVVESDHIVQVFDSGIDRETGAPYMVMELLQGEDLEHVIDRVGPIAPEVAVKIVRQAAIGLAKAHDAGIVHRDIKPANLFLTRRDSGELWLKLLDFGIAKVRLETIADVSTAGLTSTGTMLGTPLYMSPEQARGQSNIDARSDVWSLGVVLHELVSGALPYGEVSSLGDLMVAIITAEIPPIQQRAPWVSAELSALIDRALARDLSRRFADAGELRNALAMLSPEGARLTPELLVSIPAEQRNVMAARHSPAHVTSTQHATRTGFARTDDSVQHQQKRTRAWPILAALAAVALVVLVLGGITLSRITKKSELPSAGSVAQSAAGVDGRSYRVELAEPAPASVEPSDGGSERAPPVESVTQPKSRAEPGGKAPRPNRETTLPKASAKPKAEPAPSKPTPGIDTGTRDFE